MADLITLDFYKTIEGIASTKEDEKLEILIASVSQLVKTYCANSIVDYYSTNKTEYFSLDYTPETIQLTESPIVQIVSVDIKEVYETSYTTLTTSDYYLDDKTDSLIRVKNNAVDRWPKGPGGVKVIYKAGYADTPADLKLAVVDLVTYYHRNEHKQRQTLSGATQENQDKGTSKGFPDHIRRVLDLYRLIV